MVRFYEFDFGLLLGPLYFSPYFLRKRWKLQEGISWNFHALWNAPTLEQLREFSNKRFFQGRSILKEKKMNKSSDEGGAEDGNLKNSKNDTPKTNENRQQDLNLPPKKEFKQAALTNFFKPVDPAENARFLLFSKITKSKK